MSDVTDPKGLIRESYRIEGITGQECRSIFLDWALSVPEGKETKHLIPVLLDLYQPSFPDHPMTQVLREGMQTLTAPQKRRGGWRSRPRN